MGEFNIEIIALASNIHQKGCTKLVQFINHLGNKVIMPVRCANLYKDHSDIRAMLNDAGLEIPDEAGLINYLKHTKPDKHYLIVDKTGWHDKCFVFPDCIIGDDKTGIYFPESDNDNPYNVKGTLDDWKEHIGKYCIGNSRLILGVSSAFAAALLYFLDEENTGFHFVGNSSCGKSTILKVACSVWGDQSYMKTWRATDNAIEGIASLRNDTLLALDEIGQIDASKAGDVAYMLGNGQSKSRCNKDGSTKKVSSWRLLYLSSGETDLIDCGVESKKKTKAGQLIRLINIPAVHNEKSYGAFENLHNMAGGKELSEYLVDASKNYYGSISREFIKYLIKEGKEAIRNGYEEYKKQFNSANLPLGSDNQIQRAINKFALIAYAGELATVNGLTGWLPDEAKKAAIICFNDWIKDRGGISNQENQDLLKQVKSFFERYNVSRFLDLSYDSSRIINEMAGYKKEVDGEYQYWVMPTVFNDEICKGFKNAKKVLLEKGWLKSIEPETKYVNKERKRLYTILPKIWE